MLGRLRAGDARTQRSLRAARPRQRDTRGLPAAHPAATSRRGSAGSACASRCPPSSCACGADGVRGAPGMGRSGAATARGPPAVLHADGRTDGALQITHPSLQAETPLQVSPDGRPSISFLLASPLQPGGGTARGHGEAHPALPPSHHPHRHLFQPPIPMTRPRSPIPTPPRPVPALRGSVRFGPAPAQLGSAERRQRRRLLSASRRAEPAAGPARAGGDAEPLHACPSAAGKPCGAASSGPPQPRERSILAVGSAFPAVGTPRLTRHETRCEEGPLLSWRC